MILQVLRSGSPLLNIEIDENTVFSKTLMGDWQITVQNVSTNPLPLAIGDYIVYKGKNYTINKLPELGANDVSVSYNIIFEPDIYTLCDKKFRHLGAKTFTFLGNAAAHAQLIIDNINSISSGWTLGVIETTEEIYINYDRDDCRTALTKICSPENFNLEYDVDGKVINIRKAIGQTTGLVFEVGQFKGLYSLERRSVDDSGVVTRAYGYGGTTNIPNGYRGGLTELIFDTEYVEQNVNLYPNVKEGDYINTDIYPQRTGTISAASTNLTTKVFTVTDITLDFNIIDNLLENETAKIVFKSGALSGLQFEVLSHNSTTGVITYKEGKDIADNPSPSASFQAQAGDTYTLVDLKMPQSYIDVAEAKLKSETQDYLSQNSIPRVIYNLDIDEKFIRENSIQLNAGDYIGIRDTRLGINGLLRISAIQYPLVNEGNVTATISNFILDSSGNRIITAIKNNNVAIKNQYVSNILEARRQTGNLNQLQDAVFDPNGNYFTEKIKPGSIETLFLSVGAKANDFNFSGVAIQPNVNGNANNINISGGLLLHNQVSIPAGFIWVMSAFSQTGLTPTSRYYLYARCSRNALVGSFILSTSQITTEQEAGYYHFTIGVLYPVNNGYRDFDFVKGITYIVGDRIKTGRIESIDAQTYWDLTQGRFKLGNDNAGMDWNVTTPNTLTLRGALVQSPSGATSSINVFRGVYNSGTTYFKGDSVQYGGSTWLFIANTPATNITPTEGATWTALAQKGDDGTSVAIKGTVPVAPGDLPMTGQEIGDGYISNDTGNLWMWDGTSWNDLGPIRGPQGETGPIGKRARALFAKNTDPDTSPPLTQVENPSGWTEAATEVDDIIYLTDNLGNQISDNSGVLIGVGMQNEFLWMITEVLDNDGNFISWSTPNRLTGRPGQPTDYTEIRFAKSGSPSVPPTIVPTDSNPTGWNLNPPALAPLEYLWKIYGLKSGTTNLLLSNWNGPYRETAIDGIDGATGPAGAQGPRGPLPTGGDLYSSTKTYYGNGNRVDIVRYNPGSGIMYYVARTDAGTFNGVVPTDTSKWNVFGATFDSVATNLFFAQLAFIQNLGVENLRTAEIGKRMEITKAKNNLSFYDASGKLIVNIDTDSAVNTEETYESSLEIYDTNGNPTWIGTRLSSGGIVYIYPVKDMGMSIGEGVTHSGGYTTIGRKQIFSTGNLVLADKTDTSKRTTIDSNGITTNNLNSKGLTLSVENFKLTDTLGNNYQVFLGNDTEGQPVLRYNMIP